MHKIRQAGLFLRRFVGPLRKSGLLLVVNVLRPLVKNVLIPLGLTAAVVSAEAVAKQTKLIIANEEINNTMKIVKKLEQSVLLIKGISETIKNETKKQKGEFFSMLLGTLGATLLGNLMIGKGTIRADECTITAGEETIRVSQDF